MGLDLQKLRVFVAVVERNGFSAAAEHLSLSQGTVSFHVHSLERHLGRPLLHYEHRAIRLTEAGEQVYRSARRMLRDEQRLLRSISSGQGGHIAFGASMAFEQDYFFTTLIGPYLRANPQVRLSLRFGHSVRLAEAVADYSIDLAYVIGWRIPASLQFECLHHATFTLLVAHDHPLGRSGPVSAADVARTGLITAPLDDVEWVHYENVLRELGLATEDATLEIDGMQARVLAAAAGLGVLGAFRPAYADGDVPPSLRPLCLDRPLPSVEVGLVTRRADASDLVRSLADWMRRSVV